MPTDDRAINEPRTDGDRGFLFPVDDTTLY